MAALGIKISHISENSIEATMLVNENTKQIYGLLHGGASVALAETLGSIGSLLCIDKQKQRAVGVEINANHLRMATGGVVRGVAKPIRLGRSIHVWEINIYNDKSEHVCVSRITVAITQ